jgi:hypothetical protein
MRRGLGKRETLSIEKAVDTKRKEILKWLGS